MHWVEFNLESDGLLACHCLSWPMLWCSCLVCNESPLSSELCPNESPSISKYPSKTLTIYWRYLWSDVLYLPHLPKCICVKYGYWLISLLPIMSRQILDCSFHDITWRILSEVHHVLDIQLPYIGTRVKGGPSRSYQPNLFGQLVWPYCTSL